MWLFKNPSPALNTPPRAACANVPKGGAVSTSNSIFKMLFDQRFAPLSPLSPLLP